MTTHIGSCHCGGIRFEVEGDIDSGLACNCSICSRKGSLLWFVPRANLQLKTPESAAGSYTFNKHVIQASLLPHLRHSPLRGGHRSQRQRHRSDQPPVH